MLLQLFAIFFTASWKEKPSRLHTLALLWGKREAFGSVRWVSSAAHTGAGATVWGAGHLSAHRGTLSDRRKQAHLSSVGVSVLPGGKGEISVGPTIKDLYKKKEFRLNLLVLIHLFNLKPITMLPSSVWCTASLCFYVQAHHIWITLRNHLTPIFFFSFWQ